MTYVPIQPHPFKSLGGLPRTPSPTEHKIGTSTAGYTFPGTLMNAQAFGAPIYYQGQRPACGAHAGTWLKTLLDIQGGNTSAKETPRYTWINIKRDGSSPSAGTDMASIFNALQVYGGDTFEPLENNVTYDDADYAAVKFLTSSMLQYGKSNLLGTPAYLTDMSFNGIKQAINDHGAVLLLIQVCARFWTAQNGQTSWAEADILPLGTPSETFPIIDGHFIVAHSYDENYIYFANSFGNTWGREGHGYFGQDYMPWIIEAGVAANPPLSTPTPVPTPTIVPTPVIIQELQAQKISLLQQLIQVLTAKLNALLHPNGSAIPDMKPLVYSATFWFNVAKFIGGIALAFTAAFPASHYVGYAVMIESVVSFILRLQVTQPIGSVFPPKK
jgi:hypothetical protein